MPKVFVFVVCFAFAENAWAVRIKPRSVIRSDAHMSSAPIPADVIRSSLQVGQTQQEDEIPRASEIFAGALAAANEMGEQVAFVLADHTGAMIKNSTVPGAWDSFITSAHAKIKALLANDLDNRQLCSWSGCAPWQIMKYLGTGRMNLQGGLMVKYGDDKVGFFAVSGAMDMHDDVKIARAGLRAAGYKEIVRDDGKPDFWSLSMPSALQVSEKKAHPSDVMRSSLQVRQTQQEDEIPRASEIFAGALAAANEMGLYVAFVLADHTGAMIKHSTVPGTYTAYITTAHAKIKALLANDLDNRQLCSWSGCAPWQIMKYLGTGRMNLQGGLMVKYGDDKIGFFAVSGAMDMHDDVKIARAGLRSAGYKEIVRDDGKPDFWSLGE